MKQPIGVRIAKEDDAPALHTLQRRLDVQSQTMLLEPDEREATAESLCQRLRSQGATGGFDLVAGPVGGRPAEPPFVGWLQVDVAPYRRAAHVGYLVVGVDADHAGRGVGSLLLRHAADHAVRRGLRRLELTVITTNFRAVALYRRHGFRIEGRRRESIRIADQMLDEFYMGRLL